MANVEKTSVQRVMESSTGLKRTLKTRDAIMVGVGGTIGTGLFLSSGDVLSGAGPGGTIVAYLLGGFFIWLMISCLGEMSSAMPVSGTTQAYATEFVNPAMGFTIGWVNWIAAAITITAQIVASSIIMKNIAPNTPTIMWVLIFAALLFGANFFSVKSYGNVSFYFASLKLVLVVAFIIIGTLMIFGVGTGHAVGLTNFTNNGGLFPNGMGGISSVILSAFYAFGGIEMVACTAGEIEKEKDIPKSINTTIILLVVIYIVCSFVLAALLPWNQADLNGSPFAYVFSNAGINGAALIVNIIVLTSALTSGNYFVYACTRYLWSISKFGQAPKFVSKTTKKGVPIVALCISMAFAVFGVASQYIAADTVYLFLIYLIGGGNIFHYTLVCVCQIRFRRRFIKEGGNVADLNYKVLKFPLIPIMGICAFMLVLVMTLSNKSQWIPMAICYTCYALMYIGFSLYSKRKSKRAEALENDAIDNNNDAA